MIRFGLMLLLSNVVTISAMVLTYLCVKGDHIGFAVAFLVLAFITCVVPKNAHIGESIHSKNEDRRRC